MRGILRGTDEGSWLVGKHCKETLTSPGYVWSPIIWLTSPGSPFALHSVEFEEDEEAFEKMAAQIKREVKNRERDEVWVTYIGLLETWENIKMSIYTGDDGKPLPGGFGHLGAAPAQLIVKTVKDVAVIHPAQRPWVQPVR